MEERDFGLRQSRSSAVYFSAGSISHKRASYCLASFSAAALVVPVAEKYATNVFAFIGIIIAAHTSAKIIRFIVSVYFSINSTAGQP